LHCRRKPKQLSKKELSNVAPASKLIHVVVDFVVFCTFKGLSFVL
jgi:hypothetical protein